MDKNYRFAVLGVIIGLFVTFAYLFFLSSNDKQAVKELSKVQQNAEKKEEKVLSAQTNPSQEERVNVKIDDQKIISIETKTTNPMTFNVPPKMEVNQKKSYLASLKTSVGTISAELYVKQTPVTVNNFVFLSRQGFYDNTVFHRVVKDFMIQGGDPKGDGTGGPGYRFDDESFKGEYVRGTLAMANAGPDTNGSQFFIMHKDVPLPKNYVIFGKISSGMEIVDKIAQGQTTANLSGEKSKPVEPVKILSVEIVEK